jgi:magnesium chelatase subunit I
MQRLSMEGRESIGEAAAAIEFVLEGLYLLRRLSKDTDNGVTIYGT